MDFSERLIRSKKLLLRRNRLFRIRLRQYHVESCIESRVYPMMQVAFLDLERERPHFVIQLGTALVLVAVVDVLQELAVMARREHQDAGLHDVVSAPGKSPEPVIVARVEIGLPNPRQRRISVLGLRDHSLPEGLMSVESRIHELVDRSDFVDWNRARDGGRVLVDHDVGIEHGRLQNEALLPRRRTRHRSRRDVQRTVDRNDVVPVPVGVSAPPRLAKVMPSKLVGSSEQ